MLQIRSLSKTYANGVQALKGVDLDIPRGMFGLLGPNGAGKSTLMRTIATLQDADAGSIHLDGLDVLADKTGAPIQIHSADRALWTVVYPDREPDVWLTDGATVEVAGTTLQVLSTPGHTYGSICLYAPELGAVFSGDTLFEGGPGATGRSYSDFTTIVTSIRERLLTLPPDTIVHTGHGPTTTIGAEAPRI